MKDIREDILSALAAILLNGSNSVGWKYDLYPSHFHAHISAPARESKTSLFNLLYEQSHDHEGANSPFDGIYWMCMYTI
jgi:hypothetical protein